MDPLLQHTQDVNGPRAVIVANGVGGITDADRVRSADLVIAADGGAEACRRAGIRPDFIIGDMDSLDPETRRVDTAAGVTFLVHPEDKDKTDLELAVDLALEKGAAALDLVNALGGRWDMSLANIFLLDLDRLDGLRVCIQQGPEEIRLLRDHGDLRLAGTAGDGLSLVPLSRRVTGVCAKGVRWPLHEATLRRGATRSISNAFAQTDVHIRVGVGRLFVVWQKRRDARPSLG